MHRLLPVLCAGAALTLSACTSTRVASIEPIDGRISGQCHVDMVRGAVGLAAAAPTVERARVDSDSLEVRVVLGQPDRPASATLPEAEPVSDGGPRLTIETGDNNAITAIYCG